MIYVTVYGQPTRQLFFTIEDAQVGGEANLAKHVLLRRVSPVSAAVSGDDAPSNANLTVSLDDRYGAVARLFNVPPVGAECEVRDALGVRFAGVVKSITLGAESAMVVEA